MQCFYCNKTFAHGATIRIPRVGVSQSTCSHCLLSNKWLSICTMRTLFMNVRSRLSLPVWYSCELVCRVDDMDLRVKLRPTTKLINAYLGSVLEYFHVRHEHKRLVGRLPIVADLKPLVWAFLYRKHFAV